MPIDLKERLGTTACGERFLGRDTASGRTLLVTLVRVNAGELAAEVRSRTLEAARAGRGLVHPHVCAQVECGITQTGQLAIAQECPDGGTGRPASVETGDGRGPETLVHLCEGMAYAHARGVVHGAFTRDCLVGDGADGVRIADFGAGGALYAAGQLAECGRDAREMAPEVRAGEEPTPAADVFSLGVVGILLCAAPGVAGGPQADTLAEQARRVPGTGLASVLGRAIERDPAARYGSAEELLAHLRRVTTPRPAARPAAAQRRARPPREPDPSAVPEMGYGKALGLMLWALLRSAFVLLLCLGFIAGAVAGGLALAFRDTPRLVAVPSVERKTVAEAVALAKARRLEAAIGRQVYSSDVPEGKVVEQTPFAGKTVREGRSIELVVSRGPARQEVPDLVGASLSRARDLLEAADLQLGAVSRDPGSPKPADEVLTQNPQAGKPVPVDTEVNVTVSGKRGAAPPPGEPDTGPRAADISVVVPEGPVVQRVRVEVHYPSGRYTTAYERVHRPGETARTHVVASGPASVQIFIDGDLIDECELEPEP